MKKFNLFGLDFKFEIKKEKKDEENLYSEENFFKNRILYFLLVMILISLSSKIPYLLRSNNYKRGDIVKEDIYAPKSIIFRDDEAKEKIIEDMIAKSEKKYIYSADVEEIYLNGAQNFFDEIKLIKENKLKSFDYSIFEKTSGKKISAYIVDEVLKIDNKEIENLRIKTIDSLNKIYSEGIYKEKNKVTLPKYYYENINNFSDIEKDIIDTFIAPNYIYDVEKTRDFIESKVSQIKDQYIEIKAGTLIARTGEVLTDRKINILKKLDIYNYKTSLIVIFFHIIYLILTSTLFFMIGVNYYKKDFLNNKSYKAVILLILVVFLVFRFTPKNLIYAIPLDTALFLLLFITRFKFASFVFMTIIAYLLPMLNFDVQYLITYAISMLLAGYFIRKVITRSGVIGVGIELAVIRLVFYCLFSFFSPEEIYQVAFKSSEIMIAGLISGMLTIALLPYFERTFNILTIFRLIELGDLSHPLLSKLSIEAPGTFQHSMMVAVLSENAVRELGGNEIFTRVACYYHDIGKTKRPKFYVENQNNGENPHNNVSPFMSKLIILSHTKDGSDMGKEYQIPKEIRDIMFEHQGTTLLAYFYNKAKAIDPNVNEEEFRYSGPKPQTKESAVIMLADSIEAAVRSMDVKNPISIEQMIRKIVHAKIDDNQLSDANITFKEIDMIIKSFVKTFGAIYHERIKYPGQEKNLKEETIKIDENFKNKKDDFENSETNS